MRSRGTVPSGGGAHRRDRRRRTALSLVADRLRLRDRPSDRGCSRRSRGDRARRRPSDGEQEPGLARRSSLRLRHHLDADARPAVCASATTLSALAFGRQLDRQEEAVDRRRGGSSRTRTPGDRAAAAWPARRSRRTTSRRASSTASSKVIGMFAGGLCGGRLPTLIGQSTTFRSRSSSRRCSAPAIAPHRTMRRNLRAPEAQRLLEAVDRVRRVGVELLVARLAHLARPVEQRRGRGELGQHEPARDESGVRVRPLISASPPPRSARRASCSSSWRSSLTSVTATAGTNFRNSRNSVEKRPMVPMKRQMSTQVGA